MDEKCEFPAFEMPNEMIQKVIDNAKTIAVVGLSTDPGKAAHRVPAYMQAQGYRIIPVHPSAETILGEKVWSSLDEIPEHVDVVNVFRPPSELPGIVAASIRIGAGAVWAQEGIVHNDSADRARAAGLDVIMGRCIMKDHKAFHGQNKSK